MHGSFHSVMTSFPRSVSVQTSGTSIDIGTGTYGLLLAKHDTPQRMTMSRRGEVCIRRFNLS